jgi:hypothetical protein
MFNQEGSLYSIGVGFKMNYMINCSTMVAIFNSNILLVMWHHRLGHLHYKVQRNDQIQYGHWIA